MISASRVYATLLKAYGKRGWWPVTARGGKTPRYHPGTFARPSRRQALEICVGAILTQNTAWTNVVMALESLHAANALDAGAILAMPGRRLARLIRSSGFFVQKAKKLKAFVEHLVARGIPIDRWLQTTPLRALREELLSIHGVGPETADSMLLYAGGRPSFVVDAYTRRIGSRLGWFRAQAGTDEIGAYLTGRLPRSVPVYQEFHALLVELAKRACRTLPACPSCPLVRGCPEGLRRTS